MPQQVGEGQETESGRRELVPTCPPPVPGERRPTRGRRSAVLPKRRAVTALRAIGAPADDAAGGRGDGCPTAPGCGAARRREPPMTIRRRRTRFTRLVLIGAPGRDRRGRERRLGTAARGGGGEVVPRADLCLGHGPPEDGRRLSKHGPERAGPDVVRDVRQAVRRLPSGLWITGYRSGAAPPAS